MLMKSSQFTDFIKVYELTTVEQWGRAVGLDNYYPGWRVSFNGGH